MRLPLLAALSVGGEQNVAASSTALRGTARQSVVATHRAKQVPCFRNAVTEDDRVQCARNVIQDILSRIEASKTRNMSKKDYCQKHAVELTKEIEETQQELREKQAHLGEVMHNCKQCNDGHRLDAEDGVRYAKGRIDNLEDQVQALDAWCSV